MPGWAGTERYLTDLTLGLRERGHEVTIACADGSKLDAKCHEVGIPHIRLVMRRTLDWRQLPAFVQAMRRGYDVVHIHGYRDYVIPAVAARLTRVPAVVMTRHLPHAFRSRSRARLCSCLFYDKIIAVSHFVQNVLLSSGVPAERVAVVHNAIGPTPPAADGRRSLREEFGIPADAFLVAAAGRIEPPKGFDVLVRAMQRVDGHCIIFGGGDRSYLESLVLELGLSGRVHVPGFRPDVARLWASADVAVVPSTSPDCFPYAAIEALAAGVPLVGSRIGGIPETCDDGCAVLVPPGDVGALAAALSSLAASAERRRAMGAAGRARAAQFTFERMIHDVEQVYHTLLDEQPCRTR